MFSLPAILSQSSVTEPRLTDFSFCPQNVNVLRGDRAVDGNFSYCPQDETLFQPPRTVNGNYSYCPQDKLKLAITLATEPTAPTYVINTGQHWYDSTNSQLKYWDGDSWELVV